MNPAPSRSTPHHWRLLLAVALLLGCIQPARLALAMAPAMRSSSATPVNPDAQRLASACSQHEGWADPAPPARIYGNTWYVGTCGITVLLVTTANGHVLIDGGPQEAASLVLANIRKLGFDPRDVRWIVTSHEHFDHIGAVAALKVATGAKLAALDSVSAALVNGQPSLDDPQRDLIHGAPPVTPDRILHDGGNLTLEGKGLPLVLTVHATPAHSPGSASWTWQSCDKAFACRMIAYADSLSTPTADGYRFSDHPDRIHAFKAGAAAIAGLPCDILLTPHPAQSAMWMRFAGKQPLAAGGACESYANGAMARFSGRLAAENGKVRVE